MAEEIPYPATYPVNPDAVASCFCSMFEVKNELMQRALHQLLVATRNDAAHGIEAGESMTQQCLMQWDVIMTYVRRERAR